MSPSVSAISSSVRGLADVGAIKTIFERSLNANLHSLIFFCSVSLSASNTSGVTSGPACSRIVAGISLAFYKISFSKLEDCLSTEKHAHPIRIVLDLLQL